MDHGFYKDVLDAMADGVYFMNLKHRVTFWNKAAERLTGYSADEVVGKSCADNFLRHVDACGTNLCGAACPMKGTMEDGRIREADVFMHHRFGHRVPVHVRASPMRDEKGKIIGSVEVFNDNSRKIDVLAEIECLRQEVLKDPLVGTGNRRFAEITMQNIDCTVQESGVPFGVVFVDIDRFKAVNDTWGHAVGDRILCMIGKTLSGSLRPLDSLCRMGGEEFALFIPNTDQKDLSTLMERLRMLVENCWLDHDGEQIRVTISLGGAVSGCGECAETVLERADHAMYQSKQNGRNRWTFAELQPV